jgi:hypothetical protein
VNVIKVSDIIKTAEGFLDQLHGMKLISQPVFITPKSGRSTYR